MKRMFRALGCAALLLLLPSVGRSEFLIALGQGNQIFSFNSTSLGTTSAGVTVTGLAAGDTLVGIDTRPLTSTLYGFANNGGVGRLYTIDPTSGIATLSSQLSQSLTGSFFGVDFNPVADRLRVTSDVGENLRINVSTGETIVDTPLSYAAGDTNAGTTPNIFGSAYTNSFAGTTSTVLFNIDGATQSLVSQIPPNGGVLNTIGSLGEIAFADTTFEISGSTGIAYAVLNGNDLAQIDLGSGAATFLGSINGPSSIIGLTSGIAAVPEPSTIMLLTGLAGCVGFVRYRRNQKILSLS